MDGDRFDAIIRSLAQTRSRRAVFSTIAAGATGAVLTTVGAGRISAKNGITLCHQPGTTAQQSLTVDASALSGHLSHGDYLNPSGCCAAGVAVCLDGAGNGTCCFAPSRCLGDGSCCMPYTCTDAGANCGTIDDGCGGAVDCGACSDPESCGGGGIANVCGCTPTDCAAQGATCGTIADGCGSTLNCGSCDADNCLVCGDDLTCASTCSGGAVCCGDGACGLASGAVGCAADSDCCSGTCVGGVCQAAPGDGGSACDSDADCAAGIPCIGGICCSSTLECGGKCCTDVSQVCFESACCAPKTCADQGANCGEISDTCGSQLDCGTCTVPQTCGGGGTANVCGGCAPTTCQDLGYSCGEYEDNCGGTQDCGSCGDDAICFNNVCMPLVMCQELLESCTRYDESAVPCCDDLLCWDGAWPDFTHGHCCLPVGSSCTILVGEDTNDGCCPSTRCVDVGSTDIPRMECVGFDCDPNFFHAWWPGAEACTSNSQCCSHYCHTQTGNCCAPEGGSCNETYTGGLHFGLDCCVYFGLVCDSTFDGTCIHCRVPGESCVGDEIDSTCCLGTACVDGVCVDSECGGWCAVDSTCCEGQVCDRLQGRCVFA